MNIEELNVALLTMTHVKEIVDAAGDALLGIHVVLDFGYERGEAVIGYNSLGELALLGEAKMDWGGLHDD